MLNPLNKPATRCAVDDARAYERRKARWLVKDAIKKGTLTRGNKCELVSADCSGPIEGHHDDYSKPLVVRWICRWHHRKVDGHKMARPGNRNGSAPARGRTENLAIKSRLLCQLSYGCDAATCDSWCGRWSRTTYRKSLAEIATNLQQRTS